MAAEGAYYEGCHADGEKRSCGWQLMMIEANRGGSMVEFSSEPIGAWALPFGHALASHHKQPLRGLGVSSVCASRSPEDG